MALIIRVLLFLASIVFTIVLLIGATTSFAKDEFNFETLESNFRLYTIEWIDVADEYGKKVVCGTKVSTFDYSGRKFVLEYFYLLNNDNKIVTRFLVNAIQLSLENVDPIKTEKLKIKLFGFIISKDGENILAGMRGDDHNYKGIATEYAELDLIGNTELFKTLYRGGYNLEAYFLPSVSKTIPIAENTLYTEESEKILLNCITNLLENHEQVNRPKGEVFMENAYRTG